MNELTKRLIVGGLIGFAFALFVSIGSHKISYLKKTLDGYENLSYDARMKYKIRDVEAGSMKDVIIIDIGNLSINPSDGLGRFQDWPQTYHGQLIDAVTNSVRLGWAPDTVEDVIDYYQVYRLNSEDPEAGMESLEDIAYDSEFFISGRGNWENYNFFAQHVDINGSTGKIFPIDTLNLIKSNGLLFDIIFDPQDTTEWRLVYDLTSSNESIDEQLTYKSQDYLFNTDPRKFIRSTSESDKTYHGIALETLGNSGFTSVEKMETEPMGYDSIAWQRHIIELPMEQAKHLPTANLIGNTHLQLLSATHGAGSVNFPQDEDGIIRRAPTAIYFEGPGHVYPSITLSAFRDILDIPQDGFDYDFEKGILRLKNRAGELVREIPIDEEGRMYVNYFGSWKTFEYIEYMFCKDPTVGVPLNTWENKTAIVGASVPGLMDLRNTPVQETFAGVEIHANVMNSLLQNKFVSKTDSTTNIWIIICVCIALGIFVSIPSKPLYTLPVPLAAIVAWLFFTYNAFFNDLKMWEIVRPAISMGGTYLGIFLYNFLIVEKDKRFLKNTFGTYISPELIDQMYDNKKEPQLGGEEGYHTAFFTDIQSFSAFSEKLSASDLVELLNDYLTEMTDILLENKGTLDKYIGDAIVAFYGAPAPVDDHEYWACLTAIKMQERLAELREKWQNEGERWPEIVHHMQNRIGINTGPMVTGNMGSTMRMNYTMMGDTVNLAARLEASAKQYGIYIQVAEESYKACKDKFIWRDLDYVIVMGKSEPAQVFELVGEIGKMPPGYDKLLPVYDEAVKLYRNQEWAKAIEAFKASDELEDMFPGRKTNPSRIYIPRCEHYRDNSPGDKWDGSWALTKK